jgi:Mg-chelatase subunit ChlD
VRAAGIPTTVIGCVTDTLVTTDRTRTLAEALGARYEELDLHGRSHVDARRRARFAAAVSG